jgi:hypothetical protein
MHAARVRINTDARSFIPGKVIGNLSRCWIQQVSESRQTASNLSTEATKKRPALALTKSHDRSQVSPTKQIESPHP